MKLLLNGIDTLQCAYYLHAPERQGIDFQLLAEKKEEIRQSKSKNPLSVTLGNTEFLLHPYGSKSGYPLMVSNEDFKIEFGEFNKPNFYVTFRSQALWRQSAFLLHDKFLKWASSVGFVPYRDESLSRVDFSFDYKLPRVDFDENSFVTRSTKDSQHRDNKKVQTFTFGKGDVVLRVYDKVAEIYEKSNKVWFFLLWEDDKDIWRIEWQVRKEKLKSFGIITFENLKDQQGDLLWYLATEHDTLRVPNGDSNSSRWPLHPLWKDLQAQIEQMNHLGVARVFGQPAVLEERMQRMAISVYGYLKRVSAVNSVQTYRKPMTADEALKFLGRYIEKLDEPLAWQADVDRRIKEIRLGEW